MNTIQEDVKTVIDKINNAKFQMDEKTKSYFVALDKAYKFYGLYGLKVQLKYLLVNLKTENQEQEEAKNELLCWART